MNDSRSRRTLGSQFSPGTSDALVCGTNTLQSPSPTPAARTTWETFSVSSIRPRPDVRTVISLRCIQASVMQLQHPGAAKNRHADDVDALVLAPGDRRR